MAHRDSVCLAMTRTLRLVHGSGTSTPVRLRKLHRLVLENLRLLAQELHVLHRIWYKGAAQFRHMVWWRPIQRVKKLGTRTTTGILASSVPLARGSMTTAQSPTTPESPVLGVQVLTNIATVYAACWNETCVAWDTYDHLTHSRLPRHERPASQQTIDAASSAQLLDALVQFTHALECMEECSRQCYSYVSRRHALTSLLTA